MRQGFCALPSDASAQPDLEFVERFTDFVNDDLNAPRALALAWKVLRGDLPPAVKRATFAPFDRVFGLGLAQWSPREVPVPDPIKALADARNSARIARNWAEADRLRGELQQAGWEMEDRPDGYALKRK